MWTRTSDRWAKKPGSFDKLNMRYLFESSNKYGIPDLKAPTIQELPEPPSCLIPYNIRVRSEIGYTDAALSTFLDDYRIEAIFTNPEQSFQRVSKTNIAITPDFSIYQEFPLAAQIWNTYRNRWCGALWQSRGITVIPSISWSDERSFEFCFLGVEYGSPVAISTQGIKWSPEVTEYFYKGYNEMIDRINPRFVICYGKVHKEMRNKYPDVLVKEYPTYWTNLKAARKAGKAEEFYGGNPSLHGAQ